LRFAVWELLDWLAARTSESRIFADYPKIEPADFRAVFAYAARVGRRAAW
jgi:uncharacterized protein (DUF433 family)